MLNGSFLRTPRPAANSRRPFPLAVIAAYVLLAVGCGPRRVPDVEGTRAAVQRAIRLVRGAAPQQARYLEKLVAEAEIATAGEIAAPWWQRQTGRADAAWLRTVQAARGAAMSARAVRGTSLHAYSALIDVARQHVRRAVAESRETGMGRREGAALERAVVNLATAERLARAGVYDRATVKLRQARADAEIIHRGWISLHARFSDPALRREWRRDAAVAIEESRDRQTFAIVVDKLRRQLILYYRGLKMATFSAELGANGLRRKQHAGDRATPEGFYRIVQLKDGRSTKYYKALLLNYPNDDDRTRYSEARRRGAIPRRAGIGSLIEIHGEGGGGDDWTDGCVALSNADIDRVFARVRVGTPVVIVGTYDG